MPRRRKGPSAGERAVVDALKSRGYRVIQDQAGFFQGRPLLRPDVVVSELNLVVEYDGEQHFAGARKYKSYVKRGGRANDMYKDQACWVAGIHLARIPYTVGVEEIPKWIDHVVKVCSQKDAIVRLSATDSDYYDRPHPCPCRKI